LSGCSPHDLDRAAVNNRRVPYDLFKKEAVMFLLPLGDDVHKRTLPIAGMLLIGLNLLVFTQEFRLMLDDPDGDQIAEFVHSWGLAPRDLAEGKYIGCFTHMFLHGDIEHFVGNMIMLWIFVGSLEALLGSFRFVALYVAWGLIAGFTHCYVYWGSETPLIGASGAISGMAAAYVLAFGALSRVRVWYFYWLLGPRSGVSRVPAGVFVFLWIIIPTLVGMGESDESGMSGVAWFAHLGGFGAGLIYLLPFVRKLRGLIEVNADGQPEIQTATCRCKAADAAARMEAASSHCTYCGSPLSQENCVHEGLYRCPSETCQRLIMLQLVPASG
jgi:membrane associated rhomboid family serine protease